MFQVFSFWLCPSPHFFVSHEGTTLLTSCRHPGPLLWILSSSPALSQPGLSDLPGWKVEVVGA